VADLENWFLFVERVNIYMRVIQEVKAIYYFLYSMKDIQDQICHHFLCNPLASPHICYFRPQVFWCHLQRMFLVMWEAMYTLHPWACHHLKIGIHVTHLQALQKYGNQMGWELECMLDGGDIWVSVLRWFQLLLLSYEVKHCHNAKQLHLSALLCIYCE